MRETDNKEINNQSLEMLTKAMKKTNKVGERERQVEPILGNVVCTGHIQAQPTE